MSVLRRKPYIETVIGKMSSTDITSLRTAINSNASTGRYSLALQASDILPVYTGDEKIISAVELELEANTQRKSGFMIYTKSDEDTPVRFCVFIAYHRFQDLALFEIDYKNHKFTKINEYCDINELRRIIDDTLESKGGKENVSVWEKAIKEYVVQDGNTTEVGGALVVDGSITQNTANWEADIETIPLPTNITDLSAAVINYAGLKQINGVLYLALSFTYSNATESAISMNYNNRINVDITDIPESISSKILDINGVALSEVGSSYAMILCDTGNIWINSSYYRCKVRFSRFSTEANKIRIVLEPDSTMSVTAGSKLNVDARTFLVTL